MLSQNGAFAEDTSGGEALCLVRRCTVSQPKPFGGRSKVGVLWESCTSAHAVVLCCEPTLDRDGNRKHVPWAADVPMGTAHGHAIRVQCTCLCCVLNWHGHGRVVCSPQDA